MLKAPPQHFSPGSIAATTTHKAAKLRDPFDRLVKRGWLGRRLRDPMDGTIERLPFLRFQQHATRGLGHRDRQYGGIQSPPSQHAVEGQTTTQALGRLELARFNAAAAFQNPVPDFHLPDIMPPKVEAFTRYISRPRHRYATCSLWRCPRCLSYASPLPASKAGALAYPCRIASRYHIPLTIGSCQYREKIPS